MWEGIPESPPSQCLGLLVQPKAMGGTGEAQQRMLGKPEGWREGAGPTSTSTALGEFLNQAGSMIWSVKWELCERCYPWYSGMPSTWGRLPLIKATIYPLNPGYWTNTWSFGQSRCHCPIASLGQIPLVCSSAKSAAWWRSRWGTTENWGPRGIPVRVLVCLFSRIKCSFSTYHDIGKENQSWIFIARTDAEAEALTLWPPDAESTHWKRPWCWERWKAVGEQADRGWEGWMASQTQWTWVWSSSRRWWWTGKPGELYSPWVCKESLMTNGLNNDDDEALY